jgi:hypothetical protein
MKKIMLGIVVISACYAGMAGADDWIATAQAVVQQPIRWTELSGRVTNVNLQTQTLQISELATEKIIEIPVTENIKIYKKGRHEISMGDLERGDKITVRNSNPSG